MPKLIQLKQRIKAVSTIRKITQAMRLISHSFHARMHSQKNQLHIYTDTIIQLLEQLRHQYPEWKHPLFMPDQHSAHLIDLYIIIGSQKGLCGIFHHITTHWINKHQNELIAPTTRVQTVGKRITSYLQDKGVSVVKQHEELKLHSIPLLVETIMNDITNKPHQFRRVICVGNYSKSFFSQICKARVLLPLPCIKSASNNDDKILWLQNADVVVTNAAYLALQSHIHTILFESLYSEQAARFLAMDNATRNADSFLEHMKLEYNKLRQSKITEELTELSSIIRQ